MSKNDKRPAYGERTIFYKRLNGAFIPDGLLKFNGLSTGAKCLWARLYRYAGEDGYCWPSMKRLSGDLGCSERTIQRQIAELEKAGFIEIYKLPGYGTRNGYHQLNHPCFDDDWKDAATVETGTLCKVVGSHHEAPHSLEYDKIGGFQPDRSGGANTSSLSYKEGLRREQKKEDHHYRQGPEKVDFGSLVTREAPRGGGSESFEISEVDKEYIDLIMKYHADTIESPARYRRSLEHKAFKGELDKSDHEELRGKEIMTINAAKTKMDENNYKKRKLKDAISFREDSKRVYGMLDNGVVTEDELMRCVLVKEDFCGIGWMRIKIILKNRKWVLSK